MKKMLIPPGDWAGLLAEETAKPYFHQLEQFVASERAHHVVYPPEDETFAALEMTPFKDVKVVLLGQDPYHDAGQAHGLCFSVRDGVRPPPSLVNIFKELHDDTGCPIPRSGYLGGWATQGMLMLNTVLTVRAHEANSHRGHGWERFTDTIISLVSASEKPMVFVLWGRPAQTKRKLIDQSRHTIVESAHPSPLSARNGFFGSRPFSAINSALEASGRSVIQWCP
ncbi:MAG TPA: uracil-DNA glycosylase [Candidatus Kapabacteria bacterium]|nr:uracil-DNA glycosylase [Candidatus Kapabacteria bacterium]